MVLASFDSFRAEFSNIENQLQSLDSSNEEHRQYGKDISKILQLCLRHIKEFSDAIEGQHQVNPSGGAVQWSARVTNESNSTCIKSLKKIIRKLKVSIQVSELSRAPYFCAILFLLSSLSDINFYFIHLLLALLQEKKLPS